MNVIFPVKYSYLFADGKMKFLQFGKGLSIFDNVLIESVVGIEKHIVKAPLSSKTSKFLINENFLFVWLEVEV